VRKVEGAARWGSPLPVELDLHFAGPPPPDASDRIRRALSELLGADLLRLERQLAPIKVHPAGNQAIVVEVLLDDVALERAANRAAESVEGLLSRGPARE